MQDTSYHSIEDITISVFNKILETGNYKLLGKHKNPEDVWLNIFNEYCIAAEVDNTNIKLMAVVQDLKNKHDYIKEILEKLRYSHYLREIEGFEHNRTQCIKILRNNGYLFNDSKVFEDELQRLLTQLESLRMKITIEENKIEKSDEKLAINTWKEVVTLERITGVKLDPNVDVVAKLIEVRKLGIELSKQKAA